MQREPTASDGQIYIYYNNSYTRAACVDVLTAHTHTYLLLPAPTEFVPFDRGTVTISQTGFNEILRWFLLNVQCTTRILLFIEKFFQLAWPFR